ncbi:5-taurinomethyluridine-[tRNA] synthase subunit GTPB3, mitochondrial-like [Styela clava]
MLFRTVFSRVPLSHILQTKTVIKAKQHRCMSSLLKLDNTIYALSSGYGKCGVSVIRISGERTSDVIKKMASGSRFPIPRKAHLTTLVNPDSGEHLDKALVLWFPAPYSFTGEDVCEFHVHGGIAVVASVFRALSSIAGLRPAIAGEYTKRAFLNGKLDLTEVEGLGDLIHAETEEQRKQALNQMEGRLSSVVKTWSQDLLRCLAHLEALIDFGEDQHIDDGVLEDISNKLTTLSQNIENHLNDKRRGERLRSGVRLAIIGEPNVGKSTLLNLITSRPAAIVSPVAGTTRDVVETTLDIDGFPVILSDTAGIRETGDLVEIEGVKRAKAKALEADLILYIIDVRSLKKLSAGILNLRQLISSQLSNETSSIDIVFVLNKCDLIDKEEVLNFERSLKNAGCYKLISCHTGDGVDKFLEKLSQKVRELCSGDDVSAYSPSLTQERHRVHVTKCFQDINSARSVVHTDVVIGAEYLRLAMKQLGKLTGEIGAEEILEVIFKDFCIGK